MTTATPASGHPIQLTGYSWSTGALHLRWRPWPTPPSARAADTARWPIAPGTYLHLTPTPPGIPAVRRCIGYHPPEGGPPRLCPDWTVLPPGSDAQCSLCETLEARREIVVSDGSRPPTGPHAAYLLSSHEVYLAAFAPDVYKVGVAGPNRTRIRVLEQGAPAGLVFARAADGMAARRLEHAISQMGVRERVAVRTKLKLLHPPPNADALVHDLRTALDRLTTQLSDGWPGDVERLDPPEPLDNTPAMHLDALESPPVRAHLAPQSALCGQVVAATGALLVLREPQASLWGDAAAPLEAHDLRTWLGWRLVPG